MTQIEFLLTLLSIIVGLGLTALARNVRNLVRPRQAVRWHWLPLTWVVITFLIVANFWWGYFDGLRLAVWNDYFAFLLLLAEVLTLYLLCAFALPDLRWEAADPVAEGLEDRPAHTGDDVLDLEAFYFSTSHRRWYFGIFLLLLLFVESTESLEQAAIATMQWDVGETLRLLLALSSGVLIASDREWIHSLLTATIFAGFLLFIARYASGLG